MIIAPHLRYDKGTYIISSPRNYCQSLASNHTYTYSYTMKNKRLSRQDWLCAGFRTLVTDGPTALRAEPLAATLKTTKGSFYWHFSNVPEFHTALINIWESACLDSFRTAIIREPSAPARLRIFDQIIEPNDAAIESPHHTEAYIRSWARSSPTAAQSVAKVDVARLAYLSELLHECGVTNPELARVIYGAIIGLCDLPAHGNPPHNDTAFATLIDLILALR